MSDLVYSIENIFSTEAREGALGQKDAEKYYIAPYQRGYKWGATNPNDAVWLLISDINDAFTGDEEEYYLQYITVKNNELDGVRVLEVIDGQQRLTTLTLLFAVIGHLLKDPKPAISAHKLKYGVRDKVDDFLGHYIYSDIDRLLETSWEELIEKHPEYNLQDIFYMYNAVQCIKNRLSEHESLLEFHQFLNERVMLIFNVIEKGNLASEKVFSNLNTNKVELTSTELVKGLLLTRAGREKGTDKNDRHFKEILELRSTMGRQWDEIENWSESADIRTFYFSKYSEPMEGIITLLAYAFKYTPEKSKNKYSLFNFFQAQIKREGISAQTFFNKLRQIYHLLKDWYESPKIHNMLGYILFHKGAQFSLSSLIPLMEIDKIALQKKLSQQILQVMDFDVSDLSYGEENTRIHQVLLFINVFATDTQFNFTELEDRKWSLEHIFPQNPDFLPTKLAHRDLELLNKLLPSDWEARVRSKLTLEFAEDIAENKITELASKINSDSCELTNEEKGLVYYSINKVKLNSIGNMALLSGSDNSSNSNGLFDAKRHNIVDLISRGSFVPKHTYDVFAKLLSQEMESDLTIWSEKDIDAHESWMIKRIEEIKGDMVK
ncbi:hypothetical protein LNTAR_15062 [Lentisphaera araneosa HTCC2155]|uniref:GmrSD restriction endonucleases N-terminal domain-containing protein n=1 Tax=Lentisphaera araneosa HTCC2155 TaxID=313628 RepID=A6DRD7_9BACT|nr:DUF262 domain-containing protein [Lentisphaera araneosa]EDM25747.1 hypothetical protein LNTAR_15062 [Lentisphaera araneosa HTCC2155]